MDDLAARADERRVFGDMLLRLLWAQLHAAGFPEEGAEQGEIRAALGAPSFLGRWLEESLRMLDERGVLIRDGAAFRPAEASPDGAALWREWEERRPVWRRVATIAPQIDVAEAALRALPEILSGARRATDVLFPGGSLKLVEGVYKHNPIADHFNAAVAETVAAVIEARLAFDPAAAIRLIEVGAGTGGTSAGVLGRLRDFPGRIEEYCYTDLSRAFLAHGESSFGPEHPYLRGRIFNVEKPISGQDLTPGRYDVAIAANVLHATRDVRATLRNVKAALRANGVLILNELSENTLFAHLTFGLLEGWWLYEDGRLRLPGSPILSPESWRGALEAEGFRSVSFPTAADRALGQQVIVAESDGLVRLPRETATPQRPRPTPSVRLPAPALRLAPEPKPAPRPVAATSTEDVRSGLAEHLRKRFGGVLGIAPQEIDVGAPVEGYGVDSILTVQLAADLGQSFRGITATVFFEHNTIASLADHLARSQPDAARAAAGPSAAPVATEAEPVEQAPLARRPSPRPAPFRARGAMADSSEVAVIGLAGRYPGGEDLADFWRVLREGRSAIREIPPERWDWRDAFDEERGKEGSNYARYGGFLDAADAFDPLFFRISPREAERMDPQERLFLETAHACLEDAGYVARDLAEDRAVGVFVGAMNGYYPTGARAWSIANRVSYTLDLAGPSLTVDTACSSSLTAIHLAVESLRAGGCACAIAGGVNVIVDARHFVGLSEATMLSSGDKVRAFGADADGFVDGEGVGAVLLKPMSRAVLDGDRIYGVIRGTAVNHGGKTNGYTVPNPQAQGRVIERALRSAGVDARDVSYVEAHGTGTSLGDPIEISGLSRAFEAFTADRGFCAIGSAKSNIGHCESAAGIAGLTKVLLQMRHGELAPSLHAETLNPHIDFSATPFVVQRERAPWRRRTADGGRELPRLAGVSSFGAGGSNAHVVIEDYVAPARPAVASGPQVLVLSGRTEERLRARADALVAALGGEELAGAPLADVAYTLQVGREALEARLALIASSVAEARARLVAWLGGGDVAELWRGEGRREREGDLSLLGEEDLAGVVERWLSRGQLGRLAEAWTKGVTIDWTRLHAHKPHRVQLPTYPFERGRYWIDRTPEPVRSPVRPTIETPPLAPELLAPVVLPEISAPSGPALAERVRKAFRDAAAGLMKMRPQELSPDAELAEYGFDSITLAQLANRLNEAYALDLSASEFFEARTIAGVADRLSVTRGPALAAAFGEASAPGPESAAPAVAAPRVAPLSHAQRRLWLLEQMEDLGAAYHVPLALRLSGRVDADAMRRAVAALTARHESLRTRITLEGEDAVQTIDPPGPPAFTVEDVPGGTAEEREAAANALKRAFIAEPFDLSAGPLMRARLARIAAEDALLVIVVHHIVTDGWSMDLLGQELAELYAAETEGRPAALAPLATTYADFAASLRTSEAAGEEAELDHWLNVLRDARPESTLPADRPRPARRSHRGDVLSIDLSPELTAGVRALARRAGATLFVALAAGLKTLIGRLSGQEEVVIGTAIAARRNSEHERIIGFFADTLALRTDLADEPSFLELLERVKATAQRAYSRQELRFERLVEALNPERDLARHPVFQVMLTLRRKPPEAVVAFGPHAEARQVAPEIVATPFDLTLHLLEGEADVSGTVEFALDLFDRETVARFMRCYVALLEAAVGAPEQSVWTLPMLDDSERRRWLTRLAGPEAPRSELPPVHERIAAQAAKTPDAIAVDFRGRGLSYAELDGRANRLAHHLRALGLGRDTAVGVCLERSEGVAVALLAVLKAGGAYLPLDPAYPEQRLRYMLEDSGASVLVTESALIDRLDLSGPQRVLIDDHPDALADRPEAAPEVGVAPEDLAYVIYTSGSTGKPKGVMISHGALSNFLAAMAKRIPVGPGDVLAAVTPLSFDIAGLEFWLPLTNGATVAVASREAASSGEDLRWFLCEASATLLQATPATWRMLVESGWRAGEGLTALCGGEALTPDLAEALSANDAVAWNLYGPTETTIWSSCVRLGPDWRPGSIGTPIDNTKVYVVDARMQLLPPGVPGELCIAGAGLARGYLGRPELTEERFPADPFGPEGSRLYRTGDLARIRENGEIEYLGRLDHQVKIRGHRIELGEIEATLREDPAIAQAVVVARDVGEGDRRLAAYVTLDPAEAGRAAPASDDDAVSRIDDWRAVWDGAYDDGGEPGPSFAGWNARFTGRPIPEPEMRLWLDGTVRRIEALRPRRLLEIGCGLGLLLERLAPSLDVYCGADVSGAAIARLTRWIRMRRDLGHVRLACREAADYWEAEPGAFDVVVLNSVAQYFPSADHLKAVLARAIEMAPPGGRIFVGDLRPFNLLPIFHMAGELARSGDAPAAEIRAQAARALAAETELTLDPGFFFALREECPRLTSVEASLKRDGADNELTRYRYDVVLHVEHAPRQAGEARELAGDVSLEAVARELESRPAALVLRGALNGRLAGDLAAAAALREADPSASTLAVRAAARPEGPGLDPAACHALGEGAGYRVAAVWSPGGADGRIDVAFVDEARADLGGLDLGRPGPQAKPRPYANQPQASRQDHGLVDRLKGRLRSALPDYMTPPDIVTLERFPLTPNGKIDRAALPPPDRSPATAGSRPPSSPTEATLAAIWAEVLGLPSVGVDDDFFALGGHSLLVMRIVARVRHAFGVEIAMRELFEAPTVVALAARLEQRVETAVSPAAIRSGARGEDPKSVVLQRGGGEPLFFIHAIGGGLRIYDDLVRTLGDGQMAFGLNGLRSEAADSVEGLAEEYAAEIGRLRPSGELRLAGWSFGGIVAYETGRRLAAEGRSIRSLAMIDPCLLQRPAGRTRRLAGEVVWAAFVHILGLETASGGAPLDPHPDPGDFAGLAGLLRGAFDRKGLERLHAVFARNMQAWAAYRPTPAPLRVDVYRASVPAADEAIAGREFIDWAELAEGADVMTAPGDHFSMMRPPHVAALGASLRATLGLWQEAG
ncbi:amino acid adenylation domain-containing protein [Hansschlegelia sp. KR7-227]|uniref:amino acid adenylation domain-containing protein n=1 Tax=Hansschlegelia sp. KR7-227 TaxID=3400914 RepID=UPI003C0996C5